MATVTTLSEAMEGRFPTLRVAVDGKPTIRTPRDALIAGGLRVRRRRIQHGYASDRDAERMVRRQRLPCGPRPSPRDRAARADRRARGVRVVDPSIELAGRKGRAAFGPRSRGRGSPAEPRTRPPLLPCAPIPRAGCSPVAPR